MKSRLQGMVRRAHLCVANRGLPKRMAILLHALEPDSWPKFRELANYLREQGYRFTGPEEFEEEGDDRRVFLSFDDNYRCWHEALPLFEELEVVATFYLNPLPCRDRVGSDDIADYYDRLHFDGTREPLSTAEVRDLSAAGHTVANHTYSHFMLAGLADRDAREEIQRGKESLEEMLGEPVLHFSWPYGMRRHFSEKLREFCTELGCRTIASAIAGLQHGPHPKGEIHRTPWHIDRPLDYNVENLCVDGRLWERLTGRNAAI